MTNFPKLPHLGDGVEKCDSHFIQSAIRVDGHAIDAVDAFSRADYAGKVAIVTLPHRHQKQNSIVRRRFSCCLHSATLKALRYAC